MITLAWAQEELFIVLNPSLTKAHRTRALKVLSKSMFAKVGLIAVFPKGWIDYGGGGGETHVPTHMCVPRLGLMKPGET